MAVSKNDIASQDTPRDVIHDGADQASHRKCPHDLPATQADFSRNVLLLSQDISDPCERDLSGTHELTERSRDTSARTESVERGKQTPSTVADLDLPNVVQDETISKDIFVLTAADDSSIRPIPRASVWIGSWNLCHQWPTSEEILQFLPSGPQDLIVIGARNPLKKRKWLPYLTTWLEEAGYVLLKFLHSNGIWMTLAASKELAFSIHDVQTAIVGKRKLPGTLHMRCTMGSTSCLFVYAAFPSEVNAERDTLLNHSFGNSPLKPKHWTAQQNIFLTDRVFLFGGLHYDSEPCGNSPSSASFQKEFESHEECSALYGATDILRQRISGTASGETISSQANMLWRCFAEAPLNFPPTSKFHAQSNDYDRSEALAWPERILWKKECKEEAKVMCIAYGPLDVRTSRSRPVAAEFELEYTPSADRTSRRIERHSSTCCRYRTYCK